MRGRLAAFALVVVMTVAASLSAAVAPAPLVLPAYTGEGAVTRPVIINPTDADVQLYPDSLTCDLSGCHVVPGALIAAGARYTAAPVTPANHVAGIYHLTLDPSLIVYSQIITGAGALFRVPPLQPVTIAEFLDVSQDGPFNGFLFLATDAATSIDLFGHTQSLGKDEGAILATPASGKFKIVSQLGAPRFYVFAGINSQSGGSLQIVMPR